VCPVAVVDARVRPDTSSVLPMRPRERFAW